MKEYRKIFMEISSLCFSLNCNGTKGSFSFKSSTTNGYGSFWFHHYDANQEIKYSEMACVGCDDCLQNLQKIKKYLKAQF